MVDSVVSWTLGGNLEDLRLSNGYTLDINATGNELANKLTGNWGNNVLDGGQGADSMAGGTGNDTYYVDNEGDTVIEAVGEGIDTVYSNINTTLSMNVENGVLFGGAWRLDGNELDNTLTGTKQRNLILGDWGDDFLNGMGGSDTVYGGPGNDTIVMGRGYGIETIHENDYALGRTDVVLFNDDVGVDQLWFAQTGKNLEVSLIGSGDKLVVEDWYDGSQCHIQQFKTSNGKTLLDTQVQNLVQAMAGFSPPTAGQTTLPANYQSALSPVIAANWH